MRTENNTMLLFLYLLSVEVDSDYMTFDGYTSGLEVGKQLQAPAT